MAGTSKLKKLGEASGKAVKARAGFGIAEKRRPSDSERRWAETTLAAALAQQPEKPIGAATGTNLDEAGAARFTTISGRPVRRLYTPGGSAGGLERGKVSRISGRSSLHPRDSRHGLPGEAVDDAAVFGIRLAGGDQSSATCICWSTAATDSRWPSTCRP